MPRAEFLSPLDWIIIAVYFVFVAALGFFAFFRTTGGFDRLHGSRSIPIWMASISVVIASLSAASFIGNPQQSFVGNMTYVIALVAALLGAFVTGRYFVPVYFEKNVSNVYEILELRFGGPARRLGAFLFIFGRLLSNGARLYIAAIPMSLILFAKISPSNVLTSIAILTIVCATYTAFGGIRAVIYTDLCQFISIVVGIFTALIVLWNLIPLSLGEIVTALTTDSTGSKLEVIRLSTDLRESYTLWTLFTGLFLFYLSAFAIDQDFAQILLTCRNSRSGSWSIINANLLIVPIHLLLLIIGLLLFIFYSRPDLMGSSAPTYDLQSSKTVFTEFILNHFPIGLRGLVSAALIAVAMGNFESAVNAIAQVSLTELMHLRKAEIRNPNFAEWVPACFVFGSSLAMGLVAVLCFYWQQSSSATLVDFALGVMTFAYGGLLGVFLTAMFTTRGTSISAICGMVAGLATVVVLQFPVPINSSFEVWARVSFPWQMFLATLFSFLVSFSVKPASNR